MSSTGWPPDTSIPSTRPSTVRASSCRLFALGFSRATFGAFLVVTTVQAIFIHANVRLRFGGLRWLIATPQFHHWHHALDPDARDSNFAGELPVIDWLFGTLHLPADRWPDGYGIDETQPDGYLRQLAWPFRSTAPAGSGQPPPPVLDHRQAV